VSEPTEPTERPTGGLVIRGAADVAACDGDSCWIPPTDGEAADADSDRVKPV